MNALSLPKSLRPYADKIASVEDYRASGEGYWAHLAIGWRTYDGETHSIHEDTLKDVAWNLKNAIPCTEPGCCLVPHTPESLARERKRMGVIVNG